jgi:hypothetical protein
MVLIRGNFQFLRRMALYSYFLFEHIEKSAKKIDVAWYLNLKSC